MCCGCGVPSCLCSSVHHSTGVPSARSSSQACPRSLATSQYMPLSRFAPGKVRRVPKGARLEVSFRNVRQIHIGPEASRKCTANLRAQTLPTHDAPIPGWSNSGSGRTKSLVDCTILQSFFENAVIAGLLQRQKPQPETEIPGKVHHSSYSGKVLSRYSAY